MFFLGERVAQTSEQRAGEMYDISACTGLGSLTKNNLDIKRKPDKSSGSSSLKTFTQNEKNPIHDLHSS